jgi:3D (Asp-Asp-Asp) domain-containing protein
MTISLTGTTGFHVDVAGVRPDQCVEYVEDLTFVNCNIATGPWRNVDGSNAGTDVWTRLPTPSVDITASDPRIPSDSRIISGGSVSTSGGPVLTHSDLTLTVTDNGSPAVGQNVTLKSDRPLQDTFTQPGPSDFAGHATAAIETRRQPGPSTVTSSSGEVLTNTPAVINWLPARYESSFETSCYITSLESDFASDPVVVTNSDIPGLPSGHSYHKSFVSDVMMQGTGLGLDNAYLHYNGGGHFIIAECTVTKTGVCARDGTTLAVDPTVVPMLSTVSISSIGDRTAQDTGGKILDYKVDIYYGVRRSACMAAGRPVRTIDLKHY